VRVCPSPGTALNCYIFFISTHADAAAPRTRRRRTSSNQAFEQVDRHPAVTEAAVQGVPFGRIGRPQGRTLLVIDGAAECDVVDHALAVVVELFREETDLFGRGLDSQPR
jgi:hypothetical protein